MTQIGSFAATSDGFAGEPLITARLALTLVETGQGGTDNAPDYRVFARPEGARPERARREIGAACRRVGDKAGAYVAVQIDDPLLRQPRRANLFQADPVRHVLVWARRPRHGRNA